MTTTGLLVAPLVSVCLLRNHRQSCPKMWVSIRHDPIIISASANWYCHGSSKGTESLIRKFQSKKKNPKASLKQFFLLVVVFLCLLTWF